MTALVLIISGGTLTVVQANAEKVEHTAEEIKALLTAPASLAFFGFAILLLCFTFYLVNS